MSKERTEKMNFEEKLRDYAALTAKLGVNVKSDRYVYLNCDIEAADFGRLVEEVLQARREGRHNEL